MLTRRSRLTTADEFQRVVRRGRRAGSSTLVVHCGRVAESPSGARAGFVVSKAVGNAVTRNLVQRRLRELMRERLATLSTGSEVVVRALPASARVSYAQLGADLDHCLHRACAG